MSADYIALSLTEVIHSGVVNIQVLKGHRVLIHHFHLLVWALLFLIGPRSFLTLLHGDNEEVDSIRVELFIYLLCL